MVQPAGSHDSGHGAFLREVRDIAGMAHVLADGADRAGYERDVTRRHTGTCVAVVVGVHPTFALRSAK